MQIAALNRLYGIRLSWACLEHYLEINHFIWDTKIRNYLKQTTPSSSFKSLITTWKWNIYAEICTYLLFITSLTTSSWTIYLMLVRVDFKIYFLVCFFSIILHFLKSEQIMLGQAYAHKCTSLSLHYLLMRQRNSLWRRTGVYLVILTFSKRSFNESLDFCNRS